MPHRARTIDQQRTPGTPATHTFEPRLGQLAAPTIEEAGASDSAYVALNLKLLRNPGLVNALDGSASIPNPNPNPKLTLTLS